MRRKGLELMDLPDDVVAFAHQLFDAARNGDAPFVLSAVKQGISPDLSDASGNTLLMLAAYHGHARLVAELASQGASINQTNDRGQTPLAGAIFKRDEAVISTLLTLGADPDLGSPSARMTAKMFEISLDAYRA